MWTQKHTWVCSVQSEPWVPVYTRTPPCPISTPQKCSRSERHGLFSQATLQPAHTGRLCVVLGGFIHLLGTLPKARVWGVMYQFDEHECSLWVTKKRQRDLCSHIQERVKMAEATEAEEKILLNYFQPKHSSALYMIWGDLLWVTHHWKWQEHEQKVAVKLHTFSSN